MSQVAHSIALTTTWLVAFDALAEVSDKVPSVPVLWALPIFLGILALLLGLLRPWAALIPGIFALTGVWSTLTDFQETAYVDALRAELGASYIWNQFAAWTVAFLISVFVFIIFSRRIRAQQIDA